MEKLDLLESSLSWSEFWATMACGAVAVGLIIEYRSDFRKAAVERSFKLLPLGALLVTLGVALEFAFQVRTSVLVSEVRGIQQKQASDATERAGKAEKDAAEAKLALAKMNADRVLTEIQISELTEILSPYGGATFWAMTEKGPQDMDSEQELLTKQLIRVFISAGWKKENRWSALDPTKISPEFIEVSSRGCDIDFAADAKSSALGNLVTSSLKNAGIECRTFVGVEIRPNHIDLQIGLR